MRLIMVTQRVGVTDPILAFIPNWIRSLARRVEHLWIVTPRAEQLALPRNVTVCEVGRDYTADETILHALRSFHDVMWRITQKGTINGIFTHMLPKYAIISAPYARWRDIPLVMWYTHKSVSWQLRLAGALVDRIVTASPETCRLNSPKVRPIGHGIDTSVFQPPREGTERCHRRPTVLTVGRVSPIKHLEVLIEAAHILVHRSGHEDLRVVIAGGPPNQNQAWYMDSLRQLTDKHLLDEQITFAGKVPYKQIVSRYRRSDVFVSASKSGVDKVVLEAMACATPVVVSDPVFQPMLKGHEDLLLYPPGDADALADRLEALLAMPERERRAIGRELRSVVERSHTTGALMDKLLDTLEEIS